MMVGDLVEIYIHKADRKMVDDIYANEMTISEFIEDKENYIHDLENILLNLQGATHQLKMEVDDAQRLMSGSPLRYEEIKKH